MRLHEGCGLNTFVPTTAMITPRPAHVTQTQCTRTLFLWCLPVADCVLLSSVVFCLAALLFHAAVCAFSRMPMPCPAAIASALTASTAVFGPASDRNVRCARWAMWQVVFYPRSTSSARIIVFLVSFQGPFGWLRQKTKKHACSCVLILI